MPFLFLSGYYFLPAVLHLSLGSLDDEKDDKLVLAVLMLVVGFECALGDGSVNEVGGVGGISICVSFEESVNHYFLS